MIFIICDKDMLGIEISLQRYNFVKLDHLLINWL
jgi:hypothetical protein